MLPLSLALLLVAGGAQAHGAGNAASSWSLDAWTVLPLLAMAILLGRGTVRLARRAGRGAGPLRRQSGALALGWACLVLALVSPLASVGHVSFSAHMLQHELLMLVAAPLIVLGRPTAVLAWGVPAAGRQGLAWLLRPLRALGRAATQPLVATMLQAAVLWLWHAPPIFDRALRLPAWHAAQHLSFLLAAVAFWVAILDRCGRSLGGRSLAALCLFASSLVSGALGALMALSESPWYAGYAALGLTPSGLSPAEDQQLAGLLMWVPGGLLHAGAALALLGRALSQPAEVPHARLG
ncbi:cytochrome c oxidase assembly protein [Falsiroseomonas sp. HW251]|uniref:cytochrome c oxidase assembly protein n=1 Tax=Falsiroseomonas sp. HW251 TaxID=3390998 RepID=UPI003D31287F